MAEGSIHNPILYLHEYEEVPEEIFYRKNDEELRPWHAPEKRSAFPPVELLNVGIGTYKTTEDGEIYLCVLIHPESRKILSYSLGVYRSPRLVGKALENLFAGGHFDLTLLSSQNPVYRKPEYGKILEKNGVKARMTAKGSRGGVMAVSTFFSQLMRKKGSYVFRGWQEAIDWLSEYIWNYNCTRSCPE
ncbi:MAG: hypothetical protein IJP31_08320 [Lachnospiraceae bacterium]|nr:hypothetical protein [Lachnospiraceae bacterium]